MAGESPRSRNGSESFSLHRPSIRRRSVEERGISKFTMDKVLVQIEFNINQLKQAAGKSMVQLGKYERNLGTHLDDARDLIESAFRVKDDRKLLVEIFGGDCRRIVHLRSLCDQVELTVDKDERRLACIQQCDNVTTILKQLGFGKALELSFKEEEALRLGDVWTFDGESGQDPLEEIANAIVKGSQALELEEMGSIKEAVENYIASKISIGAAIKVCQAAAKFKKLAQKKASAMEEDIPKLQSYYEGIDKRIGYLEKLKEDEKIAIAVQEHIEPPQLKMLEDRQWLYRLLAWCGAVGAAAGGTLLIGPFGGLLVGGLAAVGASRVDSMLPQEGERELEDESEKG